MKKILLFISFFIHIFCFPQNIKLSISPIVNQKDLTNQKIIKSLTEFLNTKNSNLTSNEFWLKSDYDKFTFPYYELVSAEKSKFGDNFFQPSLMEIIDTKITNVKVVKIAYLGYENATKTNLIKFIYNILANIDGDKIYFSNYLNYSVRDWQKIKRNDICYYISPQKKINEGEIENQINDLNKIQDFFDTKPILFNYFSCVNPKEIFQIKGFDYFHKMYSDDYGGFVEEKNNVFSGNNSEIYSHEIVHIYTHHIFTNIDPFFDEGIATMLFGSGKKDFEWHKNNFKIFLERNPNFNVFQHLNVYEELYIERETPIPYIISAIICEKIIKEKGKNQFFEIINKYSDIYNFLEDFHLNEETLNKEIRKALKK